MKNDKPFVIDRYKIGKEAIFGWYENSEPKSDIARQPTKIDDEARLQGVGQYPDDYQWQRTLRANCAQSSLSYALKQLGITHKKVQQTPQENAGKRAEFLKRPVVFTEQKRKIVYLDEGGFKHAQHRPYGYAPPKGGICYGRYDWHLKNGTSAIGAIL
ncbi:IS630 transposase-related protein [Neisseria iguanae]|uniref:IS630 transposase-related protein n=1 Tax=Neisseria iguanae TaxID=90242 RepID=UPI001473A71A|nr:IS630 transposase-related protein [Neisseria iguanae]